MRLRRRYFFVRFFVFATQLFIWLPLALIQLVLFFCNIYYFLSVFFCCVLSSAPSVGTVHRQFSGACSSVYTGDRWAILPTGRWAFRGPTVRLTAPGCPPGAHVNKRTVLSSVAETSPAYYRTSAGRDPLERIVPN